jgi:hypothetical protein
VAQVANSQGGTQSNKDQVQVYPSVALIVGKKSMNDKNTFKLVNASASHQTFQSESACCRPDLPLLASSISSSLPPPASSSIRNIARACSSVVSQPEDVALAGKSGRTNMAQIATKIVVKPSM